jgi:hypothetical protein
MVEAGWAARLLHYRPRAARAPQGFFQKDVVLSAP